MLGGDSPSSAASGHSSQAGTPSPYQGHSPHPLLQGPAQAPVQPAQWAQPPPPPPPPPLEKIDYAAEFGELDMQHFDDFDIATPARQQQPQSQSSFSLSSASSSFNVPSTVSTPYSSSSSFSSAAPTPSNPAHQPPRSHAAQPPQGPAEGPSPGPAAAQDHGQGGSLASVMLNYDAKAYALDSDFARKNNNNSSASIRLDSSSHYSGGSNMSSSSSSSSSSYGPGGVGVGAGAYGGNSAPYSNRGGGGDFSGQLGQNPGGPGSGYDHNNSFYSSSSSSSSSFASSFDNNNNYNNFNSFPEQPFNSISSSSAVLSTSLAERGLPAAPNIAQGQRWDRDWASSFNWSKELAFRGEEVFGYRVFRKHQRECMNAILAKRDCFVLMPTGGGKSLCYQLPSLLGTGVAVVFSPLLSLIEDQTNQLRAVNVPAGALCSAISFEQSKATWTDAYRGNLKLLYCKSLVVFHKTSHLKLFYIPLLCLFFRINL